MPSAANAPWKRSTRASSPSLPRSWRRSRRERLPHRSTLSRFLAALGQAPVEALRAVFLEDLVARPLERENKTGGLWDRQGTQWRVFDVDGTRQAASQRALPCTPDLPPAQRRLDEVCAPGYLGRKRGELRQAVKAISGYVKAQSVSQSQAVVRLDGQYGNGAIVADLAGLAYVMRGKDCGLLDLPQVQARLAQPPDQQTTHPEMGTCRALFDFPALSLSSTGPCTRVIIAARPVPETPVKVGTIRGEQVYELFYTALPPDAFTSADVVALYLHRGAFDTNLQSNVPSSAHVVGRSSQFKIVCRFADSYTGKPRNYPDT